jgi:putative ABC transport system permease protein
MPDEPRRRRVFRIPFSRRAVHHDVDLELRFHLEGRIEELMKLGMSRDVAAAEAARRFGDVEIHKRAMRAIDEEMLTMQRRRDLMDSLGRELRHAMRALRRAPTFTAMTVLTLALGLGATTAIFTILDAVVLRPLPYPHGERLVALSSPVPGMKASPMWGLARHEMFYFKEQSHTLEDLGEYRVILATVMGDGTEHQAERVRAALATASLFNVLGITPERGRLLVADDNRPELFTVGLLSHGLWLRRFGGDPAVVGKTIDIDGFPVTVVGILPSRAQLPDQEIDLWLPLHADPAMAPLNNHTYNAIGRLRQGVSVVDAQRELRSLTARFPEAFPSVYSQQYLQRTGFTTLAKPLRDDVVGELVTKALWILFGAVALVLLIAAANVANLFLVRIGARRLEVTVRSALGARGSDLAWHYLTESLALSMAAAVGAIGVAWIGLRLLVASAPSDLPRLDEVHLGWTSVAFTLGCAAVAGIVLGLLPLVESRVDLSLLREGGRGTLGSRRRLASRNALVVSQVALALVLLAAAGLLVRSLRNLRSVQPGFDADGVTTMSLSLPAARYRSYQRAGAFYEELTRRVRGLPGVRAVGLGGELPLAVSDGCTGAIIDVPNPAGERGDCVPMMQVTPGYFETLRILVKGHAPDWAETDRGGAGAVVSGAFADRFWPNDGGIGHGVRCCNTNGSFYRVTGVTGAVRTHGLDRPPGQVVYFPMIPFPKNPGIEEVPTFMHLVVRTSDGSMTQLVPAVRRIVSELDPQVPITDVQPMEQLLAKSVARRAFTMMLLATAAALALLLSAVGIYGVISYLVAQRRGEIGIRIALGARPAGVRALVVRQSLVLAAVGVGIGLVAALATTRVLGALLFGVSPTDPLVLGGATLLLMLLAAVASYAPARRASKVDPVEALRM